MGESTARVMSCQMSDCLFNHDSHCHAIAITIQNRSPVCRTCLKASSKNGVSGVKCSVGACREFQCRYNQGLNCMAEGIKVGPHKNNAYCLTFTVRPS